MDYDFCLEIVKKHKQLLDYIPSKYVNDIKNELKIV
jgi:hypothetical protein